MNLKVTFVQVELDTKGASDDADGLGGELLANKAAIEELQACTLHNVSFY